MSEIKYDPGFPYVVRMIDGEVISRHTTISGAKSYLEITMQGYGEVIDTTPKPKIPEDAEFVTWQMNGAKEVAIYADFNPSKPWDWAGICYSQEELLVEIGDAEVTVLVRKDET